MVNICSKLTIGELVFRNRVVVPPMASQTALKNGQVSLNTISHYRRLGTSGASMVMVEYSFVDEGGRSEENQLGVSCDSHISGLKKLVEVIHEEGCLAALQIVHAGGKSTSELTNGPMIGASSIPVPVRSEVLEVPVAADLYQIHQYKTAFVEASRRALEAGFDMVELHAAHGYGLNQWLSPITNKREDRFGGDWYGRGTLLFEIVSEIRNRYQNLKLSVRLPGQDYLEGGMTKSDSLKTCQRLEQLGVSIINVSSGIGGWRRPRNVIGEGYLVSDARFIQQKIGIPVIGVGGIKTKNYINNQLNANSFSFAAIGRGILEDPSLGRELGIIQ